MAEKAGLVDTIAPLLEEIDSLPRGVRRDEALLRRAEAAAREGALGEAMGSLDRLSRSSRLAPLAALARARVVARSGDAEGLARLFAAEAERLLGPTNGAGARTVGVTDGEVAREAAHLLVRAAVIHHQVLHNARAARDAALRALGLQPDYAPAREVLRGVFAELREWAGLAQLLEADASAASSESRKQELHKVLLVLHRDVLRDPSAARRFEPPGASSGDEIVAATRAADQAGDRYVSTGEGAEEVIRQLRSLSERAEKDDRPAAAGLRLLASRIAWEAGAERSAMALAEEAFRCGPGSAQAAELERQYRTANRNDDRLEVLTRELEAVEKNGRGREIGAGAALPGRLRRRRRRKAGRSPGELATAARGEGPQRLPLVLGDRPHLGAARPRGRAACRAGGGGAVCRRGRGGPAAAGPGRSPGG